MHTHINTADSGVNWPLAIAVSLGIHLMVISGLPLLKSNTVIPEPEAQKPKVRMTIAEKKPLPLKTVAKKPAKHKPVTPPVAVPPRKKQRMQPVLAKAPVQPVNPVTPTRHEPAAVVKTKPVSTQINKQTPVLQARLQPQHHSKPVATHQRAVLKDRSNRVRQTGPTVQPVTVHRTVKPEATGHPQKQKLQAAPPTQSKWMQASVQPVAPKEVTHTISNETKTGRQKAEFMPHQERFQTASFVPPHIQPLQQYEIEEDQGILSADERNRILSSFSRNIQRKIARNKIYPSFARKQGYEGRAVVAFELGRDGHLVRLSVDQSSGHEILDEAAMKAIRESSPYETIPAAIQDHSLTFKLPISFSME